jgi:hypothetical protein
MADSLSARRSETNQFYLAANTAILSVAAVLSASTSAVPFHSPALVLVLSIVGIVFSVVWLATISSYRSMNRVKFRLINEMEGKLPVNPYEAEWGILEAKRDDDRSKAVSSHKQLTNLERIVPYVFIVLFIALFLWTLVPVLLSSGI